ncbi:hypothetical protein HY634_02630 [Candidatus Uhrbacteria bacterium]|nr:hypothetical protein [Candidatus Uhrbacteria bacterium]
MDPQLLNHLLQLASKTGDRLIVVDPASQRPFVLMGIAQYEELVGSNDHTVTRSEQMRQEPTAMAVPDPVVQRANAELAAWRASQPAPTLPTGFDRAPVNMMPQAMVGGGYTPEPLQSATADDDRFYVEPLE